MVRKQQSRNRVYEMFFDELERRGNDFEDAAKELGVASVTHIVQCWKGIIVIPVSFIPSIARFLSVDPPWLLRIYLEDCLPDTMKMIEQCGLSMLLTEREKELILAYRNETADQVPLITDTDEGMSALDAKERQPPTK